MSAWYHVCRQCNAKWFAKDVTANCPRCGDISEAGERLVPPWQRENKDIVEKTANYFTDNPARDCE